MNDYSNDKMMYLGMQNQAFSFPMFDAQALWSLQYILKNITVPCKSDMLKDIKTWSQRYLLIYILVIHSNQIDDNF